MSDSNFKRSLGIGLAASIACVFLCALMLGQSQSGQPLVGQGRLAEAEPWLERAGQTPRIEAEPAAGTGLHYARGLIELARGRNAEALSTLKDAERFDGQAVVIRFTVAGPA